MSLGKTTLADYTTEPDTEHEVSEDEEAAWTPRQSGESAKECQNCGEHVTKQFARVFGDNQNEVFGCLDCMNASEVKRRGTLKDCDGEVADSLGGGYCAGI